MTAAAIQDRREWEFQGVEIQDVDGIKFARHHVIPIDVFSDSRFLRDLQAAGWWSQGGSMESYKTNGLSLPWTIDGVKASVDAGLERSGSTAHSGGHTYHIEAIRNIIKNIDEIDGENKLMNCWWHWNLLVKVCPHYAQCLENRVRINTLEKNCFFG